MGGSRDRTDSQNSVMEIGLWNQTRATTKKKQLGGRSGKGTSVGYSFLYLAAQNGHYVITMTQRGKVGLSSLSEE